MTPSLQRQTEKIQRKKDKILAELKKSARADQPTLAQLDLLWEVEQNTKALEYLRAREAADIADTTAAVTTLIDAAAVAKSATDLESSGNALHLETDDSSFEISWLLMQLQFTGEVIVLELEDMGAWMQTMTMLTRKPRPLRKQRFMKKEESLQRKLIELIQFRSLVDFCLAIERNRIRE